MAKVLQVGSQAAWEGSTAYDLHDKTTDHNLWLREDGGRLPKVDQDGVIMATYRLVMLSSTKDGGDIANGLEILEDLLEDAADYITDRHNDTPVYLWDYSDAEDASKTVIRKGELLPTNEPGFEQDGESGVIYYTLFLWTHRRPLDDVPITAINGVEFSGTDAIQVVTGLKGDKDPRINELEVTSDNLAAAKLEKLYVGFRPLYKGATGFDPILEAEDGTIVDALDTSVGSVADSNTYPSGSSADNVMEIDFDNEAGDIKRFSLSLFEAFSGAFGSDLLTNGGAENGDMTGWTQNLGTITAETTDPNTGTYHFQSTTSGVEDDYYTQNLAVTPGYTYKITGNSKLVASTGGSGTLDVTFWWLDSALTPFMTILQRRRSHSLGVDGDYVEFSTTATVPQDAAYIGIRIQNTTNAGSTSTARWDDIAVQAIPYYLYRGDYLLLCRSLLSAAGDANIRAEFGYGSSTNKSRIGDPQKVTNTDWKFTSLGVVSFPPQRAILDENFGIRLSKLTIDLYAEIIDDTSTPILKIDCFALVPYAHHAIGEDLNICANSEQTQYAPLTIYTNEIGEIITHVVDTDFTSLDESALISHFEWYLPRDEFLCVAFAERAASHEITDAFDITLKYLAEFKNKNTDTT